MNKLEMEREKRVVSGNGDGDLNEHVQRICTIPSVTSFQL